MGQKLSPHSILVCDDNPHQCRLAASVLNGAGFQNVFFANDGIELLEKTVRLSPRVVITSSRIPHLSGLDFTRKIRAGYLNVNRALSIIVMTDTPTQAFLDAARAAGVDEMMVMPFNGQALLSRVEAVLLRPRRLIETPNYTGPCRRRRMLDEYGGPLRRTGDGVANDDRPAWEAEPNRELMREAVAKIAAAAKSLEPGDIAQLKLLYGLVRDLQLLADEVTDKDAGEVARSLGRYLKAIASTCNPDAVVVRMHIDVLRRLDGLGSEHMDAREEVVRSLGLLVDKRLKAGAKPGAHAA